MVVQIILKGKDNHLANSGYTKEEEQQIYDEQLNDILINTRWYLDNFHWMPTYRVYWNRYSRKNSHAVTPKQLQKD